MLRQLLDNVPDEVLVIIAKLVCDGRSFKDCKKILRICPRLRRISIPLAYRKLCIPVGEHKLEFERTMSYIYAVEGAIENVQEVTIHGGGDAFATTPPDICDKDIRDLFFSAPLTHLIFLYVVCSTPPPRATGSGAVVNRCRLRYLRVVHPKPPRAVNLYLTVISYAASIEHLVFHTTSQAKKREVQLLKERTRTMQVDVRHLEIRAQWSEHIPLINVLIEASRSHIEELTLELLLCLQLSTDELPPERPRFILTPATRLRTLTIHVSPADRDLVINNHLDLESQLQRVAEYFLAFPSTLETVRICTDGSLMASNRPAEFARAHNISSITQTLRAKGLAEGAEVEVSAEGIWEYHLEDHDR